jgi:hypothetical protein
MGAVSSTRIYRPVHMTPNISDSSKLNIVSRTAQSSVQPKITDSAMLSIMKSGTSNECLNRILIKKNYRLIIILTPDGSDINAYDNIAQNLTTNTMIVVVVRQVNVSVEKFQLFLTNILSLVRHDLAIKNKTYYDPDNTTIIGHRASCATLINTLIYYGTSHAITDLSITDSQSDPMTPELIALGDPSSKYSFNDGKYSFVLIDPVLDQATLKSSQSIDTLFPNVKINYIDTSGIIDSDKVFKRYRPSTIDQISKIHKATTNIVSAALKDL